MAQEGKTECPWQDGLFECHWDGNFLGHAYIKGMDWRFEGIGISKDDEERSKMDLELGEFESADKRGLTITGLEKYAVKITLRGMNDFGFYGNVTNGGKTFVLESGDTWDFMDEEALKKQEEEKDPWDNYSHFYDLKPDDQGRIIWITGGTGMGKTTTSDNLRKKHDFVLYEGDCFIFGCNPYSGNSPAGPSIWGTKRLRGVPEERIKQGNELMSTYMKLVNGEEYNLKHMTDFYDNLCDDILNEKAKIGGNWVVPQAVYLRSCRDFIRKKLGPQCKFVLLNMSEELQIKRLAKRFLGSSGEITEQAMEKARGAFKDMKGTQGYQRMEDDEPNSVTIEVDESMDVDRVTELVLERTK